MCPFEIETKKLLNLSYLFLKVYFEQIWKLFTGVVTQGECKTGLFKIHILT